MKYSKKKLTSLIKQKALELGFNGIGISKAKELDGFNKQYSSWIEAGYNAQMEYMERNTNKRADPTLLVEGAKSVISLITSYYPEKQQPKNIPQIAKYAYGVDYHSVLKNKMNLLWDFLFDFYPELQGRMFVDSAPVSDKLWAVKAGLGWIGKNSCLINKQTGSFVFISELIINLELEYDQSHSHNYCGNCTKCIDACPTNAIVEPGVIDSNRCISYQTIENKSSTIPNKLKGQFGNWIFGCDICQDVCPWNKSPLTTLVDDFAPLPSVFSLDLVAWQKMEKEDFNKVFKNSPLKRTKFEGLKRNVAFISKKE